MSHTPNPCGKHRCRKPAAASPGQGGSLNTELPAPKAITVGGNRMKNPMWKQQGLKHPSLFRVKVDTPVLDGMGNLRGIVLHSSVETRDSQGRKKHIGPFKRTVKINWGQQKMLPRFDMGRLPAGAARNKDFGDGGADEIALAAVDRKAPGQTHVYVWNVAVSIPKCLRSKNMGREKTISGWIPLACVVKGKEGSTRKKRIQNAFACAKGCMKPLLARRAKIKKVVARYEIVDLPGDVMAKRYGKGFPDLRVARGGEGNKAVKDYLARTASPRAEEQYVNVCWCLPGNGGLSCDTVPLGTEFHVVRKKTARIPLYEGKKLRRVKSTLKWLFGYVRHPAGGNKVARRYGWVAQPALRKLP